MTGPALGTRAVTAFLEPVLWYDLADHPPRDANGRWTGNWTSPGADPQAVDQAEAIRFLAGHPLGAYWAERIQSTQAPPAVSWQLWHQGPGPLVDAARHLALALAEQGIDSALSGSLSVYLQRPFRLSPDIDFALPARLDEDQISVVLRCVERVGGTVTHAKASYVGGHLAVGSLRATLDIEAGNAYGLPPPPGSWDRRPTVLGIACLSATDLIDIKRQAGRLKDAADLSYVQTEDGIGGS
jgi:hypothetical protein